MSIPGERRARLPVVQDGPVHKTVAATPQHVADIVATLSWTPQGPDELLAYLQVCVDTAVAVLGGAHCAGITVQLGGHPFTAVHTDILTLEVDARQYAAGDGPCRHALRTGQTVTVDVATSRQRWPESTADAEAAGIRSFLAAPLGASGNRVGAVNLYSHDGDGFTDQDTELLVVLSDHVTRALADYARLTDATALAAQLREAMATRAVIEQAKGILMAAHQITAGEAFTLLRAQSQETNTKLHDIAVAFVARSTGPPPP